MKKFVCMAMAVMLAMGAVPVYAAEDFFVDVPHIFTAKVGTTEFTKDGEAQSLDVPVYIKDGYTMLPLRTFMTAALEPWAQMHWADGTADVLYGYHIFTFDVKNNKIMKNGEEIPVYGKMEVRDGRVFVPLRNWGNILQALGYIVEDGDITWDAETKLATIHAVEQKLDISNGLEKPVISGEGKEAEFAMELTSAYDEIEPLGDGYFLAQKYVGEENVGLGQGHSSAENVRYLLDAKGNVLQTYNTGTDNYMDDGNEGMFRVGRSSKEGFGNGVIDWKGETVLPFVYNSVEPFYEGLAKVTGEVDGKIYNGFANTKGEIVIPLQYKDAEPFSEGLAAVCLKNESYWENVNGNVEYIRNIQWGYIDQTGKLVIEGDFIGADPFYEGLAKVRTEEGTGYIDKKGNIVIPCQYRWGGYFRNGVTYVTDDENNTWLIDKTGEKLKLIAEGKYVLYVNDRERETDAVKNGILQMEQIIDLPDGDHTHVFTYFDETGEISYEAMRIRKNLSEGLSPYHHNDLKKYGYVNENGEWIIAPAFDKAESFEDGYAIVANEITLENGEEDVEWGIIRHPNK